jgi:hypothetical protein
MVELAGVYAVLARGAFHPAGPSGLTLPGKRTAFAMRSHSVRYSPIKIKTRTNTRKDPAAKMRSASDSSFMILLLLDNVCVIFGVHFERVVADFFQHLFDRVVHGWSVHHVVVGMTGLADNGECEFLHHVPL